LKYAFATRRDRQGVQGGSGAALAMGWKRIIVTVGKRIDMTHLAFGTGASAKLMAARPAAMLSAGFTGCC